MSFVIDRTEIDARFLDVRALITFIKTQESDSVPPADSDAVKILRGLFYVHLYGAFEKSVNEVFQKYLRQVDSLSLRKMHVVPEFWPAAFDSDFRSLQATSGAGHWKKRGTFVAATGSDNICSISESVFSDQLQNVWSHTLETAISYLGLGRLDWSGLEKLAVDEVVEKRNQVAHGRTAPVSVGGSARSNVLESRLEALSLIVNTLADRLEGHASSLLFVRGDYRADYQNA